MKKTLSAIVLLLIVFAFAGCAMFPEERIGGIYAPEINPFPSQAEVETHEVVLYFPMEDQQYLSAEKREIEVSGEDQLEYAMVLALIDGPDQSSALVNAFWEGVYLESVSVEESVIYVTLSESFLSSPGMDTAAFQRAQQLAIYSIVNTLTETERFARIQINIDRNGSSKRPLREEVGFADNPEQTLEPLGRNNTYILTPRKAADMYLNSAESSGIDIEGMLKMTTSGSAPNAASLRNIMGTASAVIERHTIVDETIAADEQSATVTVDIYLRPKNGSDLITQNAVNITLVLESDIWKVDYSSVENVIFKN